MTTTADLKELLFKELESLQKGESTVEKANAVSSIASQIICACRAELESKREEIRLSKINENFADLTFANIKIPSLTIRRK